ncbi:MAG: hypothetical protein IJQ95_05235 [Paludibacteraceae bacterium]|nr:hypothetical protein [Paludibacteraceae bacterium]
MKKIAIALTCIAMAFASISCSKSANDPDSIDLTKYNPQDAPSCWEVTSKTKNFSGTVYEWANEYTIAAEAKAELEAAKLIGFSATYSWKAVSASDEKACTEKNNE